MAKKILVLSGPNLDMLGRREPGVYGSQTLAQIEQAVAAHAAQLGVDVAFYQSNSEGALIDQLHRLAEEFDGCIFNAGAYTHYSYAIRDAISCTDKPVVEVHLSNVHRREEFRHTSVISAVCAGVIAGFGADSYLLALDALARM